MDIKSVTELGFPSIAHSLGALGITEKHEELEDDQFEKQFQEDNSPPTNRKNRRRGLKRQEKPPYSYIALIAMAIHKRPDRKATLAEIYTFLQENFEFFRGEYVGWRNSIRHNLSLNECFLKLPKDAGERGRKGHKWTISENCEFLYDEGQFRRRPRGYKARKRPSFPSYSQFDYAAASATVAPTDYNLDKTLMEASTDSVNVSLTSSSMAMSLPVPYTGYIGCTSLNTWNTNPYEQWYGYNNTPEFQAMQGYFYPQENTLTTNYDDWQTRSTELPYPTAYTANDVINPIVLPPVTSTDISVDTNEDKPF